MIEVVNKAKEISAGTFRPTEPYTLAGLLFLVISLAASLLVRRLERRRVAV